MGDKRLYSPAYIKEIMETYGFHTSKALGQNFLTDGNIVRKIASAAEITKEDNVLEIGPGIGTLTEELSLRAKSVTAVELDTRLLPILAHTLGEYKNINIVSADILETDLYKLKADYSPERRFKVVANLPYYVTTPIITELIKHSDLIESIVVMVQKEVKDRMLAKKGTKDYGSLSLFVQYHAKPENVLKVPKTVFIPAPKVDSAVMKLRVREDVDTKENEELFEFIRAAFATRRKTLINSLNNSGLNIDKEASFLALKELGIDEKIRAENLSIAEFEKIYKYLKRG